MNIEIKLNIVPIKKVTEFPVKDGHFKHVEHP